MKKIFLDLETTGLDFDRNKIIEVGMVEWSDSGPTGREYFKRFNNEGVSFESVEIQNEVLGYSIDILKNAPYIKDHIVEIVEFIGDSEIIIHNSSFDITFLSQVLLENNLPTLSNKITDTILIAREFLPTMKSSLTYLANYFNIYDKRKFHNALDDAKLLSNVYKYLIQKSKKKRTNINSIFQNKIDLYKDNKVYIEKINNDKLSNFLKFIDSLYLK